MNTLFWERALKTSKKEAYLFLITVIISGFILSFRKWGTETFDYKIGLLNLFLYSFIFFIFYLLFIIVQKIAAAKMGYESTFELWPNGPLIGVLITFMSYGFIPFLYLGNLKLNPIEKLRLGKFRRALQFNELMWVGILGPLSSILAVLLIFQPLYFLTQKEVFLTAILIASAIIFFTSIPLPNTNAMNILLYSKGIWLFFLLFSIITILLILSLNIVSYVLALVITTLFILVLKVYATDFFS